MRERKEGSDLFFFPGSCADLPGDVVPVPAHGQGGVRIIIIIIFVMLEYFCLFYLTRRYSDGIVIGE